MNCTIKLRLEPPATGVPSPAKLKEADYAIRRRRALRRLDRFLSKGNFKKAISFAKELQGQPFGLRGFGAAKQVPRNETVLDKFEFDGINLSPFRTLIDSIMDSIRNPDKFPRKSGNFEQDYFTILQHEAGHFLMGYLLGVLPEEYSVPSVEELRLGDFQGASVNFSGLESLSEPGTAQMLLKKNSAKGKACLTTLNNFSCITLGGLVVENLIFGHARGHDYDVSKLYSILKWMELSETDTNFQVRWAALNTIFVLNRHHEARSKLVEAMARGCSVGFCIDAIERAIEEKEI